MNVLLYWIFIINLILCTDVSAKFLSQNLERLFNDEPTNFAKIARYLVHNSAWASFGTISSEKHVKGFPMVSVISVADSPKGAPSTGNIYCYLTTLDFVGQDLLKDNKLTVMFSNDQDLSCQKNGVDSMEPTCPRVMISGTGYQLDNGTEEYKFANESIFSRHPAAKNWLKNHHFFLTKVNISQIVVFYGYGGPGYVPVDEYFNVELDDDFNIFDQKLFLQKNDKDRVVISKEIVPIKENSKINISVDRNNNIVHIEI